MAVPGDRTTAYLLMRLWVGGPRRRPRIEVVPFHEIMPAVAAGRYDAGLVIHEARFTYPRHGLTALVDLGRVVGGRTPACRSRSARSWPAAGAVDPARRPRGSASRCGRRGPTRPRAASTSWRTPRRWSRTSSTGTSALYVNDFTTDLGAEGHAAVEALLTGRRRTAGPATPLAARTCTR